MVLLKKSDIVYRSKKKFCATEVLSQKEMKKRIRNERFLHNMRADRIMGKFSHLPVFQEGGLLRGLVTFR